MRIVQVTARPTCKNLYSLIKQKERELRQKGKGTLHRSGENRWKHVSYSGYIDFYKANSSISIFEVKSKSEDGSNWQLLHSFLGFLDRHFYEEMESITVLYRD